MLETVRDEHPQAVRQALEQIAPVWLGAFRQVLSTDAAAEVSDSWESIRIRMEVFRVHLSLEVMVSADELLVRPYRRFNPSFPVSLHQT